MIKAISYWSMPAGGSESMGDGGEGGCPIDQAIALTRQAGFEGMELAIGESGILTPTTSKTTCQAYRTALQQAGVICQSLASGMGWALSLSHPDPAIRRKSIIAHAAALERAAWLGASSLLLVPGAVRILWDSAYAPVEYDKAVEWARQGIAELLPVAQAVGVEICVENVWNGLFYSPLEFRTFIDSFNSPLVGVYFDAGNVLGYHQYPPHWITLLGQRIRRVHIKDFKESVGGLAGFCDLLAGDVPWPATIQALKNIGYDKTIVAEMPATDAAGLLRIRQAMDIILKN